MEKKLVNPNHLCLGCMREFEEQMSVCPVCGFDIRTYQRPKNALPLYEILNGKYMIGKVIGIGGFGITYIGWDFYQSKKVCIKEYFPQSIAVRNTDAVTYTEQISVSVQYSMMIQTQTIARAKCAYHSGLEAYIKEAEHLSKFYLMPGIVSVRDFFHGNNTAYIVMEYINGIDMKQYAKRQGGKLAPNIVFGVLRDVLKALNEVHKANIVHRDISPDNIMLNRKGEAKLIDFGAAKNFEKSENAPILLKHGYAPPEQYEKYGNQGPWTDVYSMSASIYYLLTGIRIPEAKKRQENDTVRPLRMIGIPVSDRIDIALQKGLSLRIEDRFKSIAELYQLIYGEKI